ncbi:MAG: CRISPR-associated endonuclease Cas2 [Methanobacterium sp.]|nr:MAG: CRISPR-associated endonuclease Cas2 [Methanobacterium sp.]
MYLFVVYDVDVSRVNKVHKFLRTFLHWRQNSVFEGEVTLSQFRRITAGLEEIVDEDFDSVMIYKLPDKSSFELEIIGIEKNPIELIL